MAPVGSGLSGETPGDEISRLQPEVGTGENIRFVALHPEKFGAEVERLRVVSRAPVNRLAPARLHTPFLRLARGPVILVDDAPAQRSPFAVKRRDRGRLTRQSDGAHLITAQLSGDALQCSQRVPPPVFRLLLRPRRAIVVRGIFR